MQTVFFVRQLLYIPIFVFAFILPDISYAEVQAADHRQKLSDEAWQLLRTAAFQSRDIIEGPEQNVVELKAPYRAEDATIVPVSIHTKIPQSKDIFIKKIHVYIDKNPMPLVGIFELSPESGRADLAMRVRVDTFSFIRAIAELNTGELYMTKSFVRATGACPAPPPKSVSDSIDNMGSMKIRNVGELEISKPNLVQLQIKHPNITGLQPMKIGSRVMPPPHFINGLKIDYAGKTVMQATLTFSVSMDPSFRFYFTPKTEGTMLIEASDTENNRWNTSYEVESSG
jgi:sulfur-oxidizing protein SoxY